MARSKISRFTESDLPVKTAVTANTGCICWKRNAMVLYGFPGSGTPFGFSCRHCGVSMRLSTGEHHVSRALEKCSSRLSTRNTTSVVLSPICSSLGTPGTSSSPCKFILCMAAIIDCSGTCMVCLSLYDRQEEVVTVCNSMYPSNICCLATVGVVTEAQDNPQLHGYGVDKTACAISIQCSSACTAYEQARTRLKP